MVSEVDGLAVIQHPEIHHPFLPACHPRLIASQQCLGRRVIRNESALQERLGFVREERVCDVRDTAMRRASRSSKSAYADMVTEW